MIQFNFSFWLDHGVSFTHSTISRFSSSFRPTIEFSVSAPLAVFLSFFLQMFAYFMRVLHLFYSVCREQDVLHDTTNTVNILPCSKSKLNCFIGFSCVCLFLFCFCYALKFFVLHLDGEARDKDSQLNNDHLI